MIKKSLGLLFSVILFALLYSPPSWAAPSAVSLIVMPHPDDETQSWSLIEGSPNNYKLFVFLTRGEETNYCVPTNYKRAFQPAHGEIAPSHTPKGKWTSSCVEARISSTLNFLNAMGSKDATIPSGFNRSKYTTVKLPKNGYKPQHIDNGTAVIDTSTRVYNSKNGMGKAIFFNLGDGDLTTDEVTWAIKSIKQSYAKFGIPSGMIFHNIIGPYANSSHTACYKYPHPDHKAVHRVLFNIDFGYNYQIAPSCRTDRDVNRTKNVSKTQFNNAWRVGSDYTRIGYAQKYYGWLNASKAGWSYAQGTSQNAIFMQRQSFWQRF